MILCPKTTHFPHFEQNRILLLYKAVTYTQFDPLINACHQVWFQIITKEQIYWKVQKCRYWAPNYPFCPILSHKYFTKKSKTVTFNQILMPVIQCENSIQFRKILRPHLRKTKKCWFHALKWPISHILNIMRIFLKNKNDHLY